MSASISVLVNGSPMKEFNPLRELRQGDPIAPFLFLIVSQGLSGMVNQAARTQLYTGIEVGYNKIKVNLLQFVDDTLFLCEVNNDDILAIKSMLRCFEMASGLRVNFHKSKVGVLGVHNSVTQAFSEILNCNTTEVPLFKYLGMIVGGNPTKQVFLQPIINKIQKKLSTWKGRNLSFEGRICLVKSVITAVPLYYFSFFKAPKGVCKTIRKLQRNFLWGWENEGRKIAWVRWEELCKSKMEGGMGIKDIELFNKTMLGKWKWRLGKEEHGLWKDILESK